MQISLDARDGIYKALLTFANWLNSIDNEDVKHTNPYPVR